MPSAKTYSHPPILEATIEFRFDHSDRLAIADLEQFAKRLKRSYPLQQTATEDKDPTGPNADDSDEDQQEVLFLYDQETHFLVRLTPEWLKVSRLGHYDTWESLRKRARFVWNKFVQSFPTQRLQRIRVRYVNKLELPLTVVPLHKYLTTLPTLAHPLPKNISSFFLRVEIPLEDSEATLVLTEADIPDPRPDMVTIMLDIQVYQSFISSPDKEQIWKLLKHFRRQKNLAFESSITDEARRLFNEG